ncbi:MAG: gluconeogenesis factor YvcK family protein [Candidatus Limnocylindrales bacterium]
MNGNRPSHEPSRDTKNVAAALRRRERGQLVRQWLRPGVGVKRWVAVTFIGLLLIALAGAALLRLVLADRPATGPLHDIIATLTLQALPVEWRWPLPLVLGLTLFVYGGWRLVRALVEPYRVSQEPLAELLYQRRLRARGPKVVAIGGGTGLSALLRGLKELTNNITAVVTVADDGGSSGQLRTELGIPPMGDIRQCIAALADSEPAMAKLLSYRFPLGGEVDSSYRGHAFGNLLIAALTATAGDFEEGVRQSNRVLAVRGSVVPVAGQPITLHAALIDGSVIEGQSRIGRVRGIRRVWITPESARPSAEAMDAIAGADFIIIGPGSLYTSLLPPLLVPGIHDALSHATAPRLFVCNVATQVGETEEFTLTDHLDALSSHGMADVIDAVLVNDNLRARQPQNYPAAPVRINMALSSKVGPQLIARDVVDDDNAHRHDPRKLANVLLTLYDERAIRRLRPARTATAVR